MIHDALIATLSRYGAGRVAIFGSYARGEVKNTSGINILVRFSRPKSLIQIVQVEDEIKKSIHVKVDPVTGKAVRPYPEGSMHRDGMVISG